MAVHELKTWTEFFKPIREGAKTFESRFDDLGFKVGDTLLLREYDPIRHRHTGEVEQRQVSYILTDERFGVARGFVVMGLRQMPALAQDVELTAEELARWHEVVAEKNRQIAANWRASARAGGGERHTSAALTGEAYAAHHAQAARIVRELMAKATPDLFQSESADV